MNVLPNIFFSLKNFKLILFFCMFISCVKEEIPLPTPASTELIEVFDIMMHSARVFVNVSDDGGSQIQSNGICWSKSPNPDMNDFVYKFNSEIGGHVGEMENLELATNYYVSSFLDNGIEITYSDIVLFKTLEMPVFKGSIEIESQAELDLFSKGGIQIVDGNLILRNNYYQTENNIENLNGLKGLTEIKGNFILSDIDGVQNFNDLNKLKSVGGNFEIYNIDDLKSFKGLESLEYIGGSISIYDNDELLSLEGLDNL